MKLLIVDLECTCWRRDAPTPHETIEIGAVAFDTADGVLDEFQTFVRPSLQPVLSEFCVGLTAIRQSDVDGAARFPEAFAAFLEWADGHAPFTLASWGAFDDKQMREECGRLGVAYPFAEHLNLKRAFAAAVGVRPCGMAAALQRVGIPLEGRHHRGIDDARNIARLTAHLVRVGAEQLEKMILRR